MEVQDIFSDIVYRYFLYPAFFLIGLSFVHTQWWMLVFVGLYTMFILLGYRVFRPLPPLLKVLIYLQIPYFLAAIVLGQIPLTRTAGFCLGLAGSYALLFVLALQFERRRILRAWQQRQVTIEPEA